VKKLKARALDAILRQNNLSSATLVQAKRPFNTETIEAASFKALLAISPKMPGAADSLTLALNHADFKRCAVYIIQDVSISFRLMYMSVI
jgi:hypothetical protein